MNVLIILFFGALGLSSLVAPIICIYLIFKGVKKTLHYFNVRDGDIYSVIITMSCFPMVLFVFLIVLTFVFNFFMMVFHQWI